MRVGKEEDAKGSLGFPARVGGDVVPVPGTQQVLHKYILNEQ